MTRIVVYGATGFTGRLVVRSLLELGVGNVVLAGRDPEKLRVLSERSGRLEYAAADARDPDALARVFAGASVVVSTAGPFLDLGEPVVRAAVAAGAHFIDTSGEQQYLLEVHGSCDELARQRNVAVLGATAFEYGLGYCAAALLARAGATQIDLFYRTRASGLSRGTRKSVLMVVTRGVGYEYQAGALKPLGRSLPLRRLRLDDNAKLRWAVPIPGGEAIFLPHGYPQLERVTTNLVSSRFGSWPIRGAWAAAPALRGLSRMGAFKPYLEAVERGADGPDDSVRKAHAFEITAVDGASVSGDVAARRVTVTGSDPYGTTGHMVALAVRALANGPPRATGALSVDRALGPEFLEWLQPYGISVERVGL